jgi:single-strand DNA-binding protein
MLNKIILIGRTTAAPQMRYTQTGKPVCSFTLAVNRMKKATDPTQQNVDFINIVAWQNLAEICGKYLEKGKLIYVEGRLQIRSYTAQDGSKRTVAEVIASDMGMLDRKNSSEAPVAKDEVPEISDADLPQSDNSDFGMSDDLPF